MPEHSYDKWIEAQIEPGWQQAENGQTEPHDMASIIQETLSDNQT